MRHIAADGSLDSADGYNPMAVFGDAFNEFRLVEDSKKNRAVKKLHAMQGKMSGRAAYGYKTTEDRLSLDIDEVAGPVVKDIFDMYLAGAAPYEIAGELTLKGILNPTQHCKKDITEVLPWQPKTIYNILGNPVYIGRFIAQRKTTKNHKDKRQIERPESEWVVHENHHPAIVSVDVFETVQKLREVKRRYTKKNEIYPLSGLIFCNDCGARLTFFGVKNKADTYVCGNYRFPRKYCKPTCTRHTIQRLQLETEVLKSIKLAVTAALKDEKGFTERVNSMAGSAALKAAKIKSAELTKAERRVAEIDGILKRLYEDNVSGRINNEVFDNFLSDFTAEKSELSERISELQVEVEELKRRTTNANSFIDLAKRQGKVTEITDEVARRFIERIVVHEAVREGNLRTQEIEIYLSFIGKYE